MVIVHFESCITKRQLSWLVGTSLCSPCPDFLQFPLNESHVLTDTLSSFFLAAKHKTKIWLESSWGSLLQRLPIFLLQGRPCLPEELFMYLYSLPLLKSKNKKSRIKIFVLCSSLLIDHINDRKWSSQTPKLSQLYFFCFSSWSCCQMQTTRSYASPSFREGFRLIC